MLKKFGMSVSASFKERRNRGFTHHRPTFFAIATPWPTVETRDRKIHSLTRREVISLSPVENPGESCGQLVEDGENAGVNSEVL